MENGNNEALTYANVNCLCTQHLSDDFLIFVGVCDVCVRVCVCVCAFLQVIYRLISCQKALYNSGGIETN